MPVLIRDLILAAYRGFTSPVYRMTAAIGVPLLPARAKPPQIRAAEIAALTAFLLTLVALMSRRSLPAVAGLDARRLVYVWVRVNVVLPTTDISEAKGEALDILGNMLGVQRSRRYIDTTAIEVA